MTGPPASGQTPKLPTDAELLERIARGDQQAFQELVNRHARYLYGVAHSLTGNAADAEDVVQETLIAALNGKFRGESAVKTWLVGILIRQAGTLRRKKRPQLDLPETIGQPAAAQGGIEAKLDVSVMLEGLSPEHRQIIVLRELEGLSYDEIAKVLQVPRGTVESRLFRAREELRRRFKGYQP